MSKSWDSDKGGRDQWIAWLTEVMQECYRVMKNGAHALIWALPRNSHWTAWSLENAGFEVRDEVSHHFGTDTILNNFLSSLSEDQVQCLEQILESQSPSVAQHLFGSGFPKSLNLGNGRGSALKPSHENWLLVRKPIDTSRWYINLTPSVLATWEEKRCDHE